MNPHFRYQYSQKKFFYSQLQTAMKKQAVYEGTAMEEEMKLKKAQEFRFLLIDYQLN